MTASQGTRTGTPAGVPYPPAMEAVGLSLSASTRVEGRRRRRASSTVAVLVLLGLMLGALGHVAVQAKRLEVGLRLGEEQRLHHELREQNRKLQIEIVMLKAPARIETLAREKLGMAPPAAADIRAAGKGQGP